MPRVFIAIPLSPAVRSALASLPRADGRTWRWVREEQFHVTLKFLGEIPEDRVADAAEAVREAVSGSPTGATGEAAADEAAGRESLALSARGIGAFPDVYGARVLWAGLAGDVDGLRRVQGEIEGKLGERGFPRDRRPFRPHITLARSRGAGSPLPDLLREHGEREFGRWNCDAIQVVESLLGPAGPRYVIRQEIRLGSAAFRRSWRDNE